MHSTSLLPLPSLCELVLVILLFFFPRKQMLLIQSCKRQRCFQGSNLCASHRHSHIEQREERV